RDDAQGVELWPTLAARALECWTISTRGEDARLRAVDLRHGRDGLAFDVVDGDDRVAITTPLIGDYNASNLLCTIGALRALGVPLVDAARACAALTPVPGRMERLVGEDSAGPEGGVHHAPTPDALEKALAALAPLARARGGRLWCVFGCGGNRGGGQRPPKGANPCPAAAPGRAA